jgi:hypothetical protein
VDATCAEDVPFESFQVLADDSVHTDTNGQALCMSAGFECSYTFSRAQQTHRCITGMCAKNSDLSIDPDIECSPPAVLRESAGSMEGRDEATCW